MNNVSSYTHNSSFDKGNSKYMPKMQNSRMNTKDIQDTTMISHSNVSYNVFDRLYQDSKKKTKLRDSMCI
jgi:hypothetical protein